MIHSTVTGRGVARAKMKSGPCDLSFTFEQVSHQCEVEVGAEVEAHKVVHLFTVPLQRLPDLHKHFLWTLQGKEWQVGFNIFCKLLNQSETVRRPGPKKSMNV